MWYCSAKLKYLSVALLSQALDANTVKQRVYDRTVGALVPIGRALTNEIIVKIWDTQTDKRGRL